MKKIVYVRPDGGVSVVTVAPAERRRVLVSPARFERYQDGVYVTIRDGKRVEIPIIKKRVIAPAVHRDETDDEVLARILAKDVPTDAVDVRVVDATAVPGDRIFREAWTADLGVDMAKARAIHMTRIRAVRDKELARLDIEQLKGRDVAAEKQRLRDLPQAFDLKQFETPDALKAAWPAGLPRP